MTELVEAKGFYPYYPELHYTLPPKKYPIPNDYSVKTTWKHAENQQTVQCKIKYKNGQPEFQILYGTFFEFEVKSNTSVSKAVENYEKAITRNSNKKGSLSGPLLFGLQLQKLRTVRELQARQHIKPAEQYSQKTLIRHAKEFATILKQEFI
ncbi:24701_t:CDS:2 [Cetraspora pellucida]|uniref:24701_t:CDS:1 n=1 Tax=Cetraspora pellucida TaxID=1433469 RepID=A0A9N8WH53_9GLOM|nr:24701_t:CDS:2 [Cetraspora pellucida]